MHKHYPKFDCAGGMLPARKPGWNAIPALKIITAICVILALAAVW